MLFIYSFYFIVYLAALLYLTLTTKWAESIYASDKCEYFVSSQKKDTAAAPRARNKMLSRDSPGMCPFSNTTQSQTHYTNTAKMSLHIQFMSHISEFVFMKKKAHKLCVYVGGVNYISDRWNSINNCWTEELTVYYDGGYSAGN